MNAYYFLFPETESQILFPSGKHVVDFENEKRKVSSIVYFQLLK